MPFYILGIGGLVWTIFPLLLPETAHKKLPDTLQEGDDFGRDQKFWSFPQKPQN